MRAIHQKWAARSHLWVSLMFLKQAKTEFVLAMNSIIWAESSTSFSILRSDSLRTLGNGFRSKRRKDSSDTPLLLKILKVCSLTSRQMSGNPVYICSQLSVTVSVWRYCRTFEWRGESWMNILRQRTKIGVVWTSWLDDPADWCCWQLAERVA